MSTPPERQEARLRGSTKAVQRWMHLGIDPEEPVDIFGVIERDRVWLLFEPLKQLFGFFERQDVAAGIVIQSKHPLSVQRFTAAHEYGHHVLEHTRSQDTSQELFGSGSNIPLQELEAQAFAAEFLMPLALVNRALDRLQLRREPRGLSHIDAYQLSLEMGSSYRATVVQLRQLNKITEADAERLREWEPIDIKIELGDGRKPADARSDVWSVDERARDRRMYLRPGDELHVRLPEIPSGGYRWAVESNGAEDSLKLVSDDLEPADLQASQRVGSQRRRHLLYRATQPGTGTLALQLRRRWQRPDKPPADALELRLTVREPRFDIELGQGISLPQRRAYVRTLAA